jgi:DUF971 family protein
MTGVRVILPIHIPETLEFRKIGLVGQYAVHFDFSDNHGTESTASSICVNSALRDLRQQGSEQP